MIDAKALLTDLQRQVTALERDLLEVLDADFEKSQNWRFTYEHAVSRRRTGLSFDGWRRQQVTQVASGWILACVFTRFCEDNGLLKEAMLAGPGLRLVEARERQTLYFREFPHRSDLDYLQSATSQLEKFDSTREFVDWHNPLHVLSPSPDAATELLDFWRRVDPGVGSLVHDFTDPGLSTRFLGDVYQNLSAQARKDYALLQTPDFVEKFILELTLDPAIDEFGLEEVRLIDPACGSGHFLLGAFRGLLKRWQKREPGTNVQLLVHRVLRQVNGVDINPSAVSIARFRLLVAALNACGISRLADAPTWQIRVAVGDSLRFGVRHGQAELEGLTVEA
ncbi:MAG: BREX-2 system adenine-specific DNA-methyltransferase PglX, partial [Actinomycetes bacterium]